MAIEIYSKSGILVTIVDKVLSCDTHETLAGVYTLTFETLLNSEMERLTDSTDYSVLYDNDFFDVTQIQRSLNGGLYKIKFTCEHISYRLNEYTRTTFVDTGTPRSILTNLLRGTNFFAGSSDVTDEDVFEVKQDSTLRNIIFKLAEQFDADVEFRGYYVSILKHRGTSTPTALIENNVVNITKTIKGANTVPSYSITVRETSPLVVGDELILSFEKLGINENVRLIGIKRKPFTSKNVDLTVGVNEVSVEQEMVELEQDKVAVNKNYYGVNISSLSGLTITRDDENAKVIMNANEFKMQAKNGNGVMVDKIYFDPISGNYKFKGTIEVDSGSININNKFIVDQYGNAHLSGDSTIYGGRYFAGTEGSTEGFSQMTADGYEVYNSESDLKLKLGYTSHDEDYPFIQLGSGKGVYTDFGLVKKFMDGLWIGNSEPADDSGNFTAKVGYNGLFFKFSDNTAYVVKDTTMKNIYTGAAIAKFG